MARANTDFYLQAVEPVVIISAVAVADRFREMKPEADILFHWY